VRDVRKPAFLKVLVEAGTITGACRLLHFDARRVYEWRAEDPEFVKAMDEAEEAATDYLVAEALKRAKEKSDYLKTRVGFRSGPCRSFAIEGTPTISDRSRDTD